MDKWKPPGWILSPDDPKMVRHWDGLNYSEPVPIEFAQLSELAKLTDNEGHLRKIRFRVGFLALLALMAVIVSLLGFLAVPFVLLG